jgi:8-oxo-dGTP diphosphatase
VIVWPSDANRHVAPVNSRSTPREFPVSLMPKSSKLVAIKRGKVLLVRRRVDGLWMFPGGRRRSGESDKSCLRREMREELPKLKDVTSRNRHSGRKMSDAVFIARQVSGKLQIGDPDELDRAEWRKPRRLRLTATSRFIRDQLFPRKHS